LRSAPQILWKDGESFVFPWERDGWLHLYASNAAAPLMAGNFEVEQAAMTPDRRALVVSSNQDDADRRHLWRVGFDGKPAQRLTPGDGLEWSPAPLADGRVVFIHADAKNPARVALLETSGAVRDLAPESIPADFPAKLLVVPQAVTVTATDGMKVHAQLFLPAETRAGVKHPAVVFFHGGSRRQMLLGWHYMAYYNNAYAFNQFLASRGYVVLSLNYRSGIGYGLGFREAPHYGATGASEFNDVLGAAAYLRGRGDVDSARIGVWGG
jgi:dipeptidyl aminopeptidase/acylaminoacyl peptidase